MNEDLWGDVSLDEREENKSVDILRDQAYLIGKKTDNLVKGTFYKTGTKLSGAYSGLKVLSDVMKSTLGTVSYEKEAELDDKEDYNVNYRRELYSFEIYNEEYRFRIFLLNYSTEYPVEIIPDEGVCQDMGSSECIRVNDNDALIDIVRRIFATKKVRLIISRMTSQTKERIEKTIDGFAREHSSFTTKELAEAAGWSMANTSKRLNELVDKGLIKVEKTKPEKTWKRTI